MKSYTGRWKDLIDKYGKELAGKEVIIRVYDKDSQQDMEEMRRWQALEAQEIEQNAFLKKEYDQEAFRRKFLAMMKATKNIPLNAPDPEYLKRDLFGQILEENLKEQKRKFEE